MTSYRTQVRRVKNWTDRVHLQLRSWWCFLFWQNLWFNLTRQVRFPMKNLAWSWCNFKFSPVTYCPSRWQVSFYCINVPTGAECHQWGRRPSSTQVLQTQDAAIFITALWRYCVWGHWWLMDQSSRRVNLNSPRNQKTDQVQDGSKVFHEDQDVPRCPLSLACDNVTLWEKETLKTTI